MKHAKKSKRRGLPWLTVLLVLMIIGMLTTVVLMVGKMMDNSLKYESNVSIGSADNSAERIAQLQRMTDRSMITMSINASPVWVLSRKEEGVNWQIENPEEQSTKLIRVEVILDETEQKIYETGAIPPGTYVNGTKPDISLDEGEYACTAYFYSYDIETEEFLGKAGANITLYVQP